MAVLKSGTTIGGSAAIHAGNMVDHGIITTSNVGSYALTGVPSNVITTAGGQTIAGTTYFSGGESLNLYGIRGRFTNEYIHLYNKVGIGHPSGWGQGEGNTPGYGLSTYGGIVVAYGNNATSSFNGHLRIDRNWGLGDYGAEQFTIRGTYPSITLRSTTHNNVWLIHNDDNISFYYGGGVDGNDWSRRFFIPTDGNIWMSWAGDYISNLLAAKQNASTAITTSNIGSQSVSYANSAGTAGQVSGVSVSGSEMSALKTTLGVTGLPYSCDIFVEGDPNTYYPVHFIWGDQDVWRRIIIKRGYSEEAPWDPVGSGVHHGGLLLDWEGNFGGWGGADYSDRLRVFQESYTNICADMYRTTHSMGYTFFLRGGGAIYHIYSDQAIRGYQNSTAPDIAYDTNYLFYDHSITEYRVYAPAPVTSINSSRIDGLRTKKQSQFDDRYQQVSTAINTGNIGSQSVSYATSSGNSATTSQRSYDYLYTTDYLESSGAVYGTIFYDNNDRAYYVDPNSTSRLVQLNLGTTNTQIKSIDGVGYLRIYGSASNYLAVGPYDNNGWVYFENSGNASGIYFNTPGRYAFDSADVTPYTDAENSLGAPSYRWSQVYTSGWLRQYGAQGMYNQDYGTHFYSRSGAKWAVTGSGSNIHLEFRSNHESTLRGVVYADTSNQIGFLNNGEGWSFRTNSSNNAFVHGQILTINADGAAWSSIYMNDGDEGMRELHCNSNRIGFLTQAGSWGAWCNDDGTWQSNYAVFDHIGVGQGVNTNYRVITNGDYYANGGGNFWAEGRFKQYRGSGTWHDVIDSGNIGSQSVSYASSAGNADTVDGYHESAFFRDNQDRTLSVLRFTGVGGDSGNSNHSYAIYQGGGGWSHPYPDLHIGYHTGIKIGANTGYGGIRFYNDSTMETILFSVGNTDANVRVTNNLYIGSAGGWITDLLAGKQASGSYLTTSGKAADSELIDGIDSSRIIYGDGSFGSTSWSDMNNTAQKSGFFFYNQPNGNPFGDWTHWINSMGNSWNPNYGFQLAHAFHSDRFAVRVVANGGWGSWRTVIDSGNIASQSVSYADESGYSASSGSVEWTSVQNKPATFPPSSHNHDDRYYTESESDGRYLIGTTNPGSVANFTISIGNNGSYSYVQSHSGQPLYLNPVGNSIVLNSTTTVAGTAQFNSNTTWFSGRATIGLENQSEFARFAFYGLSLWDWDHGEQMVVDGNYVYVNNYLQAGNSLRAPIFYDSNNTDYYLDPNSNSRLVSLNLSNGQVNAASNAGGRLRISSYTNGESVINGNTHNIVLGPYSTRTGAGLYYAGIAINGLMNYNGGTSYDVAPHIWLGGYYRDTPGSERSDFVVAVKSGTGTSGAGSDLPEPRFRVDYEGIASATGSFRAPIFYDSEDTAYYLDPNAGSYLNRLTLSGSTHFYPNNWIEFPGNYGLYSGTNNAHFYPNNASYGSWRIAGSRNGWHGIHFDSGATLMMNSNESGVHREGYGWQWRWDNGTLHCHKNSYGGGTDAIVLDSSNVNSYAVGLSGDQHIYNAKWFHSDLGNTLGNLSGPSLQAVSYSGYSAFMSFHRWGYYAVNMGLDNDNVFRIGGWSAAANRMQLDMSGNVTFAGDVTAFSDARIKENVKTIECALDKTLKLRGVSYNRIDSDDKSTKIGVIAQEILEVVPEVVSQDSDGMYNVSYGNITALLIEAIKEQQKQIEELKSIINGLTT